MREKRQRREGENAEGTERRKKEERGVLATRNITKMPIPLSFFYLYCFIPRCSMLATAGPIRIPNYKPESLT